MVRSLTFVICFIAAPFTGAAAIAQDGDPTQLPLLDLANMEFMGGFRVPASTYGLSSMNYAAGAIAYNPENHSVYLAGHDHQDAIAEFGDPGSLNGTVTCELAVAQDQFVKASVYSLCGKELHTMFNGYVEAGKPIQMIVRDTGISSACVARFAGEHFTIHKKILVMRVF